MRSLLLLALLVASAAGCCCTSSSSCAPASCAAVSGPACAEYTPGYRRACYPAYRPIESASSP
jgi:hypothetical protein